MRGGNNGNLTSEHQRKAASYPRGPRGGMPKGGPTDESMEDAMLRYQQAKADTETLDAEKRSLDVAKAKGELIPASDAVDSLEALHLKYCAELEQLPHTVVSSLPPEIAGAIREQVRTAVDAACMAMRQRIGSE